MTIPGNKFANAVKNFLAKKWLNNFPCKVDLSVVTAASSAEMREAVDSLIMMLLDVESEEEIRLILSQSSQIDLAHLLARLTEAALLLESHSESLPITNALLDPYNLQSFLKLLLIDSFRPPD